MTRTQWMAAVGLLLFVLGIFSILLFQLRVPELPPTPTPPAFLMQDDGRAREALPTAQQAAESWQADAFLSSVGVVWSDLGPRGILRRDRWTFEFYSPSRKQMTVIQVTDGTAQRLRTTLVPSPLPALPIDRWQIDSVRAFQIWWEQGGGDFVRRHIRVTVSLKLRMEPKGARALWVVTGTSSDRSITIRIDSEAGTVLEAQ